MTSKCWGPGSSELVKVDYVDIFGVQIEWLTTALVHERDVELRGDVLVVLFKIEVLDPHDGHLLLRTIGWIVEVKWPVGEIAEVDQVQVVLNLVLEVVEVDLKKVR